MKLRVVMRKLHRWGAVVVAIPFLVVIVSGLLLQLKKDISWVQPPTKKGTGKAPTATFEQILEAARTVKEAGVRGWDDVERLDVRLDRGLVKVVCKNRWEIQVDTGTSTPEETPRVLQAAYRRSDLIESLHDGTFFGDPVKLWVFLPCAVIVLWLWVSGIYLFFLPWVVRWRRKKEPAAAAGASP